MSDVERLQKLIDDSNNIVFFGGAGVSTESGIRDFRGKNGLYKEKYKGILPEYMLSHECLFKEPKLFYEYYKDNMNCSDAQPNVIHKYLKELEDKGKLKAVITQNIDGLHQKAGSKNVLELHGTTNRCYCTECGKEYPGEYIFKSESIPKCSCGGMIRPDVVLYGEMLPDSYNEAVHYIMDADLMIVAGTSLTVQPASSLLGYFKGKHLVIINDMPTPYDSMAEIVINKSLKEVFTKLNT
ncbi:MAG: NAD-dependent protein deacylase [Bacilli bacterium]|nr:NAD-dependent protein deacylase [Bacilli bacterium]